MVSILHHSVPCKTFNLSIWASICVALFWLNLFCVCHISSASAGLCLIKLPFTFPKNVHFYFCLQNVKILIWFVPSVHPLIFLDCHYSAHIINHFKYTASGVIPVQQFQSVPVPSTACLSSMSPSTCVFSKVHFVPVGAPHTRADDIGPSDRLSLIKTDPDASQALVRTHVHLQQVHAGARRCWHFLLFLPLPAFFY